MKGKRKILAMIVDSSYQALIIYKKDIKCIKKNFKKISSFTSSLSFVKTDCHVGSVFHHQNSPFRPPSREHT